MEQIAVIYRGGILYAPAILRTAAAAAGICGFLSLYLRNSKTPAAGFAAAPLALVLSLLTARLLHWYAYAETYRSLWAALTDFSAGGFVLMGAFAGCLLSAVLTKPMGLHRDIPEMLDCMCLSGGAAIAVGRLSSLFDTSARGQLITASPNLPWFCAVTNTVSGSTEYRLATFLLQALVTGSITAVLWYRYHKRDKRYRNGDTALLFLLCYCAAQIVLDSTRYDSIYFRGNGFVSIVQVTCVITVVAVIVIFSLRMVKKHGLILWNLLVWAGMLPLLGIAGYMEYYVQRHSDRALFAYTVMTLCLTAVVMLTVCIYRSTQQPKRKPT